MIDHTPTIIDRRAEYYARAYGVPGNARRIIAATTADKICAVYGVTGDPRWRLIRGAIDLRQRHGVSLLALIKHLETCCRRIAARDVSPPPPVAPYRQNIWDSFPELSR